MAERTIEVFLASPGDVSEARAKVVAVGRQVNEAVARPLGFRLDVYGWELGRPGLGRAQDLINPKVDSCNVLIGLLGSDFGTPTGDYESGFEEEFERVRQRREAGEAVEAMVYLQELDEESEQLADPRNLAFRERIVQLARYETYETLDALAAKLTTHLSSVVVDLAAAQLDTSRQGELGSGSEQPATGSTPESGSSAESRSALERVASHLGGDAQEPLDMAVLLRAHLAASSELSTQHTSSLMHVHDLMRLYGHRGEMQLSGAEQVFVARSMSGLGDVGAGWGLLGATDLSLIGAMLFDSSEAVREGALGQLGTAGLDAVIRDVGEGIDESEEVVLAHVWRAQNDDDSCLRLLIDALTESSLDQVDLLLALQVSAGGSHDARAFEALTIRLLKCNPEAALELMADRPRWIPGCAAELLAEQVEAVGKQRLLALRDGPSELARLGMQVLAEGGHLTSDEIRAGLAAEDDAIRRMALEGALESNLELSPDEIKRALERDGKWAADDEAADLRTRYLERANGEWLLDGARWDRLDFLGVNAVRAAIARGYDPAFERAAADLRDLSRTREAAVDDLETRPDNEQAKLEHRKDLDRYADLYDGVWLTGLLKGLAAHGKNTGDADLARPYLDHGTISVREAAADVLLRVGAPEDHDRLVRYAAQVHGGRRKQVVSRLVELHPDPDWLLDQIGSLKRASAVTAEALRAFDEHDLRLSDERLDELMRQDAAEVRARALKLAARGKSGDELEQLLGLYIGAARYRYYDVINRLDRLIYAPEPIQATVRRQIGLD